MSNAARTSLGSAVLFIAHGLATTTAGPGGGVATAAMWQGPEIGLFPMVTGICYSVIFAILSGICVVFVVVIFDRRMVSAFDMGMRYLTYLLG